MKKFVLTLIVLVFGNLTCYGQEGISVIGPNLPTSTDKKEPTVEMQSNLSTAPAPKVEVVNDSGSMDTIKKYFDNRHDKENQIKILDLELERQQRELKALELQSKINDFKKDSSGHNQTVLSQSVSGQKETIDSPKVNLVYLAVSDTFKEAMIKVNGANQIVHEGESINQNSVVKGIDSKSITLKDKNDNETMIGISDNGAL